MYYLKYDDTKLLDKLFSLCIRTFEISLGNRAFFLQKYKWG